LKSGVAVVLALLVVAAGFDTARAQRGTMHVTQDSVIIERFHGGMRFPDASDEDGEDLTLPPADEIAFTRAMMLVRTSRVEQALDMLLDLRQRYPESPHIASAAASAYLRLGKPNDALKLLDDSDKAAKAARARAKQPAPAVDPLAAMRAHVLLAMGRRKDAIPWMVEAAANPRGEAFALQHQLFEWAETVDVGPEVIAAAERRADASPKDVNRALFTAEIECRAGKTQTALARLKNAEPSTTPHGQLAFTLAQRLSSDSRGASFAAPLWLELARGPYDPGVRADALRRLMNPTPVVTADGEGKAVATPVSANDLEAAWRALPPGEERSRLGLDLLQLLRARGDTKAAERVATELSKSGGQGQLAGPVDVEAGLLALGQGRLEDAGKHLERARTQSVDDDARERAEFAQAEVLFYSGQFDTALAAYDHFATAHPLSPLTNEALSRAFLLDPDPNQAPGQAPGLGSLAKGLYAETRRQWDEAATWAQQAENESRASDRQASRMPRSEGAAPESLGLSNPVRANALLLLSRVEEARGAPAAARLAALTVADSLPGDRLAPAARKRVGDLDLARGNKESALAQYEEMLARYPRSWLAAEVRRQVTDLRAQLRAGRAP
jgi:tetratricopeptide (TPR) repeat protein